MQNEPTPQLFEDSEYDNVVGFKPENKNYSIDYIEDVLNESTFENKFEKFTYFKAKNVIVLKSNLKP